MNAWAENEGGHEINDIDKNFEDNFVTSNTTSFQKLDDSEEYIKILESRLNKIKKNSNVLTQLKEKREILIDELINSSSTRINTDQDIELEEPIETNKIISHLIPEQPLTKFETAHLIDHDHLDLQKQEDQEGEAKVEQQNSTAD